MTRIDYIDPDDIETAHFMPEHSDADTGHTQVVAITPLKDRETSIIFAQLDAPKTTMIHIVFTEEETDMMIAALQENKKRWETGKVI